MHAPDVAIFFIAGTFIVMCFAVAVIIGFVVYKQRQVRSIVARKEAEGRYAEALLRTRLEVQEATLSNVSRELHDNIIQVLTGGVHQHNYAISLMGDTPHAGAVDAAKQTVRGGISDLRLLSHSLNTGLVEERDLSDVLGAELTRVAAFSGIRCTLEAEAVHQPGPGQRLLLFRIAQEAFQNILKHAGATHIAVRLYNAGEAFVMHIADDGRGFDGSEPPAASIGLRNMRERAAMMGGSLLAEGEHGAGAAISVSIPLNADYGTDTDSAGR